MSTPTPKISALLFDLGDTLLDFGKLDLKPILADASRRSYDFLCAAGHKPPPFEVYCRRQLRAIRWAFFWTKVRRWEFNSLQLLRKLCDRMNLATDDALIAELAWRWYEPLLEYAKVEDDLPAILSEFQAAGIKMGIVSNTFIAGVVHDRHLAHVGLLEFFPVRIYSSQIGYRKPSRRIFEIALEKVGARAEETMFIGDLPKIDMIGAKRVGMQTVLKQPGGNTDRLRATDHVIRRISELRPLVFGQTN